MTSLTPSTEGLDTSQVPSNASQAPSSPSHPDQPTQDIHVLTNTVHEDSGSQDACRVVDHECPELSAEPVENDEGGQGGDLVGLILPVLPPVGDGDEYDSDSSDGGNEVVCEGGKMAMKGRAREIPDSDALSPSSSMECEEEVGAVGDEVGGVGSDLSGRVFESLGEVLVDGSEDSLELVTATKVDECGEKMETTATDARVGEERNEGAVAMTGVEESIPPTLLEPKSSELPLLSLETTAHAGPPVLEDVHQLDDTLVSPTLEASGAPQSSDNQDTALEDASANTDATKDHLSHPSNPVASQSEVERNSKNNIYSPTEESKRLLSPSPGAPSTPNVENGLPIEGPTFLNRALLPDEALSTRDSSSTDDTQSTKEVIPVEIPPSDNEEDAMDEDTDPIPDVFEFQTTHGSTAEDPDTFFVNVQAAGDGERPILVVSSTTEADVPDITEAASADTMDVELSDMPPLNSEEADTTEVTISPAGLQTFNVIGQALPSELMDVDIADSSAMAEYHPEPAGTPTSVVNLQAPRITTQSPSSQSIDVELDNAPPLLEDLVAADVTTSSPETQDLRSNETILAPLVDLPKVKTTTTNFSDERASEPDHELQPPKRGRGRPRIKSKEKAVEAVLEPGAEIGLHSKPESEPEVLPEPELQLPKKARGRPKGKAKLKLAEPIPEPEEMEAEAEPQSQSVTQPGPRAEITASSSSSANDHTSQEHPLVSGLQPSIGISAQKNGHDSQAAESSYAPSKPEGSAIPSEATATPSEALATPSGMPRKNKGGGPNGQLSLKPNTAFTAPGGSQNKRKLRTTIPAEAASSPPKVSPAAADGSQDKDVLFEELKAMKIASIQARNASLEAEIAAKRARVEEVTKELENPAAETVKKHIKLLHDYNDIRDVGQGLVGMIADNRGVRIGELYDEFGVGLKD